MAEDRNNAVVVIPATDARQVGFGRCGFGEKQGVVAVDLFSVWPARSVFSSGGVSAGFCWGMSIRVLDRPVPGKYGGS